MNMRKTSGGSYLTAQEVKENEKYKWSRDSLYRWAKMGKLNPVRFTGDTRFYYAVKELNEIRNTPIGVGVSEVAGD
jgi:hypothetical protein